MLGCWNCDLYDFGKYLYAILFILIADRGLTMVVIEHDMHVVFSLAEKISVLAQGTVIVEDLPQNIKGNAKVQEAYLGGAHL